MGLISLTEEENPREVWVSGNEVIRYAQHLIDGVPGVRGTGRTKRLACKYAELAMAYPNCKVMVKDHHRTLDADRRLLQEIIKILDILKIDFEVGELPIIEPSKNTFTGSRPTGITVFIKATPKLIQPI